MARRVQAIDRYSIALANINMHREFAARLLQLFDRRHQAAAIGLVHQFCPQFDKQLLGYEFRLDYIEAIQLDDRQALCRYLQEQEDEYLIQLEETRPIADDLLPRAQSVADQCS